MAIEEMAMAWMETDPVSERVRFISAWLSREESVSALAIRFGVSRKTAYKWIGRYAAEGPSGLAARSSAPVTQAAQTPIKTVAAILKLRRKHPAWGPRKLRARLQLDDPERKWPAASTIGDILKRAGLVRPRKLRRRAPAAQRPFRGAEAPNDVWCIDFKGFWRTGDGVRVLPFTVTDAMSRYLLVCQAVEHPDFETVWPILVRAFKEYGLPRAIRSDNGPPFGSTAAGGLSRLAVNFVRMGITPERITPGKPQENGRHERMHQTLKREAATPPSLTAKAQLARLERFRRTFNEERPHEALGQIPPAKVYHPSPRLWDGKLRSPEHWGATHIRLVHLSGSIKWQGRELFVSEVLRREHVGIFQIADDEYEVRYGALLLGYINGRNKLVRVKPGQNRRSMHKNCHPAARSETSPT
jgi:putative transposase